MTDSTYSGHLEKMKVRPGVPVDYALVLDNKEHVINDLLGQQITLKWEGDIHCLEVAGLVGTEMSEVLDEVLLPCAVRRVWRLVVRSRCPWWLCPSQPSAARWGCQETRRWHQQKAYRPPRKPIGLPS